MSHTHLLYLEYRCDIEPMARGTSLTVAERGGGGGNGGSPLVTLTLTLTQRVDRLSTRERHCLSRHEAR